MPIRNKKHLVDQAEVGQAALTLVERKDAEEILRGVFVVEEVFVHCAQEPSTPSTVCATWWNPELDFIKNVSRIPVENFDQDRRTCGR